MKGKKKVCKNYEVKDYKYSSNCVCCRCSIERVVFQEAMKRLQA